MATEWPLAVVLALGGLGSAGILGLGLAALVQRRSWSYLLVTLALATLLARTAVGTVTVMGMLSVPTHHTVEHVLDVLMAALVIAAVYTARRGPPAANRFEAETDTSADADTDEQYGGGDD